jgi:hypothetical protein
MGSAVWINHLHLFLILRVLFIEMLPAWFYTSPPVDCSLAYCGLLSLSQLLPCGVPLHFDLTLGTDFAVNFSLLLWAAVWQAAVSFWFVLLLIFRFLFGGVI